MDADASGEFRRRTNTNVLQDGNTCRHFLCLPRYTTWTCIVARLQFLAVGARECMHEKPHVSHISSRQTRGDATLGCCSTTLTHSQLGFPVHLTVAEKDHRKSIANLQRTFEISQNALFQVLLFWLFRTDQGDEHSRTVSESLDRMDI